MCNVFNSFWNITTKNNFWGMSFKVQKFKKKTDEVSIPDNKI